MDDLTKYLWQGDAVWTMAVRMFICRNSNNFQRDEYGEAHNHLISNKTMNFIAGDLGLAPLKIRNDGAVRNVGKFGSDALELCLGQWVERNGIDAAVMHCVELLESRVVIPALINLTGVQMNKSFACFSSFWRSKAI